MHGGSRLFPADLGEELAQLAVRLVAPAVLIERSEPDVPVEGAAEPAMLRLDGPAAESPPRHLEAGAGKVAAVLGAYGERAAQRVEAEDRIRSGDDVDASNGPRRDQIPVDRVPEPVVEAHAVKVDRQADRAAGQRRGQEAPIGDVVLPRVPKI